MDEVLRVVSVRIHSGCATVRERARSAWRERHDDSGLDEAVTKMIWLAVGIAVAVAATAFFVDVFHSAQSRVPDPAVPTP